MESKIDGVPVLHFSGPGGPFTLNLQQATTVQACRERMELFLAAHSGAGGNSVAKTPGAGPTVRQTPADPETDESDDEHLPVRQRRNYGISRIDQPEKANHGWYVRITRGGHIMQKFFADKTNGSREAALIAARAYRDDLLGRLAGGNPPLSAGGLEAVPPAVVALPPRFSSESDDAEDAFKI
jgi:hypothetical protein